MGTLLQRWREFAGQEIAPNVTGFLATRQPLVWLVAVAIGIAVAYAVILFRTAIGVVQLPWLGTMGEKVATLAAIQPAWLIVLAPATGGLVVGLMLQFLLPARRAAAVADVIEARALHEARLPFWSGIGSAAVSAISLGSGASAGREGPAVHLGATLASGLARYLNLPTSAQRALLGAGVAAAVSASFNAPIAGALFALEVVMGHYALSAFVPIVIASVGATAVTRVHLGDFPAFIVPTYQIESFLEFPAFALLGLVCGAVAVSFHLSMTFTDGVARRVPCPLWLRPVVGGVMVGLIGLMLPEILGVGYEATDAAIRGNYALVFLLALLFAKIAATSITLASRFGGGVFSPSLYLGAMAGGAFGLIAASVFPELASSHGLYAIVGMGAVSAAVLGAPISTTLIVFELTGGYGVTIALLLAVSIATGMMQAIVGRSFFHWQLSTRGLVLHEGPHKRLLQTIRVASFMAPAERKAGRLPVIAENTPVLLRTDTLETAFRRFNDDASDRLPVVERTNSREAVGWATRSGATDAFNQALIEAAVEEHR